MKTIIMTGLVAAVSAALPALAVEIRTTTFEEPWKKSQLAPETAEADCTLTVDPARAEQTIVGFGTAVSELSWDSLSLLPAAERGRILDELCSPSGGNFTVFRTPIGSSDFARDYYSYDDHPGDFAMEKFSVAIDERALLPLLREIVRRVSADQLKIWASPWCPPKWMKVSGRYASHGPDPDGEPNDCPEEFRVYEGEEGFICDDAHFKAYARYFRKYVDAYRAAGIPIGMVMPQNEFNSAQPYPSCTWTARSLVTFIGRYLGPALEGSGVQLYFGTVERSTMEFVNAVLKDPDCVRYVKGAGFQWAGRGAIEPVHRRYPDLPLVQTEQECGDGRNDWTFARHSWELMRHYFGNGASIYEYWNLSLKADAKSRWGWRQNSLVSVDPSTRTARFNIEYYILKHASHFVPRGSRRVTTGGYEDALAFVRPDGGVVTLLGNETDKPMTVAIAAGEGRRLAVTLPSRSLTTVSFK